MGDKLPLRCHRRLSLLLLLRLVVATCFFLLKPLPVSGEAAVVTRLQGFDGPLPFYLETGYVGVEEATGTELFHYFVESERNPATDAMLLWLTGGPRCSGFTGLAFEVGPLRFVLEPYTPYNGSLPRLVRSQYSWTQMANIIFLDSPVGSGFSYARDPEGYNVGDYSSSLQVVTFLKKWLNDHPRYLSNPFYIGGESYAGKMIPLIAQYISEGIEQRQQPHINLKGYLVGNPITDDPKFDQNYKIPASHAFGIISDQLYEAAVDNCKGDYVNPVNEICAEVLRTINNLISEVAEGHVLYKKCVVASPKPMDYDDPRTFTLEESIQLGYPPGRPSIDCFTYGYYLSYFWMNDNATRDSFGVKEGTVGEWIRCIKDLPYAYDLPSSIPYHFNLTTKGYRALVYSGDHDLMVPFLGTQSWIRSLNFSIVDEWRAWHLDGQAAGFTITYANNLTFATVKGAGHTTPEYQPKESFAMAQRWLDNKPL